ncbi:TauD/TfdA family dioxygenase [Nonomuraea antimicrobica]
MRLPAPAGNQEPPARPHPGRLRAGHRVVRRASCRARPGAVSHPPRRRARPPVGDQGSSAPGAREDAGHAGRPRARRGPLRRRVRPVSADRPAVHALRPGDVEAERALDALDAALQRAEQDVVVGPGTLLVVDNHLAVHGRKPFEVRYDGTDRWLKKLTVSRNLRRSHAISATKNRRVLF